jgi:hypothetical protein
VNRNGRSPGLAGRSPWRTTERQPPSGWRAVNRSTALAVSTLVVATALFASLALAQTKPPATPQHPRRHPPKSRVVDAGAPLQAEAAPLPTRGEPDSHPVDAGTIETKTLDGGTRVFRFGEVEIEGRLRNPQLVYFLRRVRAEFAAGELGHRSFMRELSDTRHDPSF